MKVVRTPQRPVSTPTQRRLKAEILTHGLMLSLIHMFKPPLDKPKQRKPLGSHEFYLAIRRQGIKHDIRQQRKREKWKAKRNHQADGRS